MSDDIEIHMTDEEPDDFSSALMMIVDCLDICEQIIRSVMNHMPPLIRRDIHKWLANTVIQQDLTYMARELREKRKPLDDDMSQLLRRAILVRHQQEEGESAS